MYWANAASLWSFVEDDYAWLYILYENYTKNISIWIQKLNKDVFFLLKQIRFIWSNDISMVTEDM